MRYPHPSILALATVLAMSACQQREEAATPAVTPPAETAPAEPTPMEPAPMEPAPTEPAPTEPAPTEAPPAEPTTGIAPATADSFALMDTNSDGYVSTDEHAQRVKAMFDTLDTDKNGSVTAQEMDAGGPATGVEAGMTTADRIKTLDSNNDGLLSSAEYTKGYSDKFVKMDTDRNGQLTAMELQSAETVRTMGEAEDNDDNKY